MKSMIKTFFAGAAIFVALVAFAPEVKAAGELDKIKEADKIRIAVFSDKPPFGYVDENGDNQGYDVYLARRIAKDLLGDENKVEFVLVEAASRIEVLQADKADLVLANFTVTPDRAEQVDFAKPYMKVALGIASPEDAPITDVAQLAGKKLIVNKGTTADSYFSKNHPEVELIKYDQNTEAFNSLRDGRGVGLAHDNTLIFAWVRENPGFVTSIDFLGSLDTIAPAVKKGNKELLDWLNAEIEQLYKEKFFNEAYDATLKPVYGDSVDPETVVVDGEIAQ
ncbi:MAG: cysteine ABC transporter substrate-binding protein [Desulfovibrionaceae bacterium]|nr:cysteine ABC transporter substrate-binding protein [Desulfovibrionaceae bacterium]